MRTLHEIIEASKANEPVELRELRYAVCAMSGLSTFDTKALMDLAKAEKEKKTPFLTRSAVYQSEEHFRRWKAALNIAPATYLGESYNPENPDYQKQRQSSIRLFEKAAAGKLS